MIIELGSSLGLVLATLNKHSRKTLEGERETSAQFSETTVSQ